MDYLLSKHFGIEGKSGVGEKVVRKEGKDFGVRPLRNIGRRTQLQHTIKKSYKTLRGKTRLHQQERTPPAKRSSLSSFVKKSFTPKLSIFALDIAINGATACRLEWAGWNGTIRGILFILVLSSFLVLFRGFFSAFSSFLIASSGDATARKNEEETKKSFVP